MAIVQQAVPLRSTTIKENGVLETQKSLHAEPPRLLILFDDGEEEIVRLMADVLGQSYCVVDSVGAAGRTDKNVVGLERGGIDLRGIQSTGRTIIITRVGDTHDSWDEHDIVHSDHGYLYVRHRLIRHDVARFLAHVSGQKSPLDLLVHSEIPKSLCIDLANIEQSLPNLDILTFGADAIELQVHLVDDFAQGGDPKLSPSLQYVGEQLASLRLCSALPILFSTRCTNENVHLPTVDPTLIYSYLHKAIQWGCEYVAVESWLPKDIKQRLVAKKGNTELILSKSSDASPQFGCATEAVDSNIYRPMDEPFLPIAHPMMPMTAASKHPSVAEMHESLHRTGQLSATDIYAIGNGCTGGHASFVEKCMNELSLPHRQICLKHIPYSAYEQLVEQSGFGGAYLSPSLATKAASLPRMTEAAACIGLVDVIKPETSPRGKIYKGDNVAWKAIRSALTQDFVPSAYSGRAALVLATEATDASASIYALAHLGVSSIYTIGFRTNTALGVETNYLPGIDDLKKAETPFVIISALPADRARTAIPLLRHYSNSLHESGHATKVFVNLSTASYDKDSSTRMAQDLGWITFDSDAISAFSMEETITALLGCYVGYDTVRNTFGGRFHE